MRRALGFYALTLGLCLVLVWFAQDLGPAALNAAMLTPLAAVLLMLLVFTRDGRTKEAWLELGVHRAGLSGWGLALAVPFLVLGTSFGALWLSGLATVELPSTPALPYAADLLISFVVVTVVGGLGEEIGWRGYLLPRLMPLGTRPAILLTGFLHGLFHVPAILWTPYYHGSADPWLVVPLFLGTLTAAGACYGYLRLRTGSVWPAAIAHAVYNILSERLRGLSHTEAPATLELLSGESGLYSALALGAVAWWLTGRSARLQAS
ncbi:MAG: CPBP family intramembrane glutamic endopeptidase [Myxococcota bacterium]